MAILEKALNSDDASQLTKMDAYITANQAFINDLLNINVPSDASKLHLELLNASSDILSNMQSMRNTFVDPVTGMAGMSQYNFPITLKSKATTATKCVNHSI
jgi:type 1 fimbria pilin